MSQRFGFLPQQHWLKTDFDKWRDEDDSDEEAGNNKDMQLEEAGVFSMSCGRFPAERDVCSCPCVS